jgi:hypothetical protein
MKSKLYLLSISLCAALFWGSSTLHCLENVSEETAQKACALKLDFLIKHDVRNKLPQIRSIAQELIKLTQEDAASQAAHQNQRFMRERELGILTVLYLQDLTPEDQKELSDLASSCSKAINSLPGQLNEKWRQTEIYRVFLAS